MKVAILTMASLGVTTALGAVYLNQPMMFIPPLALIAVTILVAVGKIQPRHYPIYIYGLALALLWQTSMLGRYIVGVDINTEYFVANMALANGWDWGWANNNNTSAVLGFVAPLFSKMGMPITWQFKALFPALFATAPVILWYAYRNLFGVKRAYFACLFIMVLPMFSMEVMSMVKSMVALTCLALIVWFATSNLSPWQKGVGIGALAIGTVVSHYTVAGTVAGLLICMVVVLLLIARTPISRRFDMAGMGARHAVASLSICLVAIVVWFSLIGGGSMLLTFKAVGVNIVNIVSYTTVGKVAERNESLDLNEVAIPVVTEVDEEAEVDEESILIDKYLVRTAPMDVGDTYLHRQDALVRAAIGLDWRSVPLSAKIFRLAQYATQAMLVYGFFGMLRGRREYHFKPEYGAFVISCFVLLGLCVFLPFFTTIVSTSRFYFIAMFFLAPLLVVGVEWGVRDIERGIAWGRSRL